MSGTRVGLRFQATLGCRNGKGVQGDATRTLLIEVALAGQGRLKCSHTGGDAWSLPNAAGGTATAPQKCNAWDHRGRHPAMNVYVHLDSSGSSSSAATTATDGCSGEACTGESSADTSSGGSGGSGDAARCKLGVLVQHALPQLAAKLGGFSQLKLDWVTWSTQPGSAGMPRMESVAALGSQDEAHWQLLRDMVKEREMGATGTTASSQAADAAEELAIRRAKETLVEAARYFGPQAVEKVSRLTVRKLYAREYHFYDGATNVADSRRHALEWAVGPSTVARVLARNPEAKAKLTERLMCVNGAGSHGGGGGGSASVGSAGQSTKRQRLTDGSAVGGSSSSHLAGLGTESPQKTADALAPLVALPSLSGSAADSPTLLPLAPGQHTATGMLASSIDAAAKAFADCSWQPKDLGWSQQRSAGTAAAAVGVAAAPGLQQAARPDELCWAAAGPGCLLPAGLQQVLSSGDSLQISSMGAGLLLLGGAPAGAATAAAAAPAALHQPLEAQQFGAWPEVQQLLAHVKVEPSSRQQPMEVQPVWPHAPLAQPQGLPKAEPQLLAQQSPNRHTHGLPGDKRPRPGKQQEQLEDGLDAAVGQQAQERAEPQPQDAQEAPTAAAATDAATTAAAATTTAAATAAPSGADAVLTPAATVGGLQAEGQQQAQQQQLPPPEQQRQLDTAWHMVALQRQQLEDLRQQCFSLQQQLAEARAQLQGVEHLATSQQQQAQQLAAMQQQVRLMLAGATSKPATAALVAQAARQQLADLQALLPEGLRFQLMQVLQQQAPALPAELQAHASTVCNLSCWALHQALDVYARVMAAAQPKAD